MTGNELTKKIDTFGISREVMAEQLFTTVAVIKRWEDAKAKEISNRLVEPAINNYFKKYETRVKQEEANSKDSQNSGQEFIAPDSDQKIYLSERKFRKFCELACGKPFTASDAPDKDLLFLYNKLYRTIYNHYHLNNKLGEETQFSDINLCKWNLRQLVSWAKPEKFDCLKISNEIFQIRLQSSLSE
jgi:hypothetical protein